MTFRQGGRASISMRPNCASYVFERSVNSCVLLSDGASTTGDALACPSGQMACGGACVNTASSNTNCGACGVTCGGGQACSNGYCCPTGTRACGDVCVANATPCP